MAFTVLAEVKSCKRERLLGLGGMFFNSVSAVICSYKPGISRYPWYKQAHPSHYNEIILIKASLFSCKCAASVHNFSIAWHKLKKFDNYCCTSTTIIFRIAHRKRSLATKRLLSRHCLKVQSRRIRQSLL